MIDLIAQFLRSMNSRLVGEDRWVVQKFLKIFYAMSVVLHKLKLGRRDEFIVIRNFDRNLKLKVNKLWSMGNAIYCSGFHEFHEFLFLHKFLKPEMTFVDIGANLGEYTVFVAKRVKKVYSFEPLPKMQHMLQENVNLNNFQHVHIQPYGLSDKEGTLSIHEVDDVHEGLSTFYLGNRKSKAVTEVPLKIFDEQVALLGIDRIDFIKLDIEGGEFFALKGARKSIEKFRPAVMVEINKDTYTAAGYAVSDVYDFFASLKYVPFAIDKQGDLIPAQRIPDFDNIVFKPS
jgi:FkbM family methyltransferase